MSLGSAPLGTTPLGAPAGSGSAYMATGAAPSTAFGTPFAAFDQFVDATGTAPSTTFGTANVYPGYVPSLGPITQFGTSAGPQRWRHVNAGPTTRIPRAYYTFAQVLTATGRTTTIFGAPVGTRIEPSGGTLCQPAGFSGTMFGAPSASWRQTAAAAGFVQTSYGTPTYSRGGARFATGLYSTRYGTPGASSRFNAYYASGFTAAALGVPTSAIRNRAVSLGTLSAFGTPRLNRSTVC